MSDMDPHERIDMAGPWADFGFQGGQMFTLGVTSWIPATWAETWPARVIRLS